jgi:hypothetical protein
MRQRAAAGETVKPTTVHNLASELFRSRALQRSENMMRSMSCRRATNYLSLSPFFTGRGLG